MIQNGVLGTKYLLKYLENGDVDYLDIAKSFSSEIKLWAAITMYTSNNDDVFEHIPEHLLASIFNCEPIVKHDGHLYIDDGSDYEYGRGFSSNSSVGYKEHFRHIRNSLAHGNFTFADDMIFIDNPRFNYHAEFDLEWLLSLTLTCLSSRHLTLIKGLTNIQILGNDDESDNVFDLINNHQVVFLVSTLTTSEAGRVANYFDIDKKSQDKLSFFDVQGVISNIISSDLNLYPSEKFYPALLQVIKKVNNKYGRIMEFNVHNVDINNTPFASSPVFLNLSLRNQLQVVVDYVNGFDKTLGTTVSFKRILSYLKYLEEKKVPSDIEEFCFDFAKPFLLQTYANVLLVGLIRQVGLDTSNAMFDKYESKMQLSFVHAKNVYKERLKVLKRSYDSLKDNGDEGPELRKIAQMTARNNRYLDEVLVSDLKTSFFRCLRNGLIHNNISIEGDEVTIIDKERELELPFYSKKHQEKVYRTFEFKNPVYSITMKISDFIDLLDELYASVGVQTDINIAQYRQRVKMSESVKDWFPND